MSRLPIRLPLMAAILLPLALLLTAPACSAPPKAPAGGTGYVCPMPEHAQVFDHPGKCPQCGMDLVPRASVHAVAILVFDGVQIVDYTAPYEIFGQAGLTVFTVGPTAAPITTAMGMKVVPAYDFAHAPAAGVLVLPGGNVDVSDARIVDWVKRRSAQSEIVLSVCNGAFWLARAGLLDGLTATTFHGLIDDLKTAAPKARIVRDKRWVDNGKIVTAAGLSSGIEGALHVVEKLRGEARAREIALHVEYDWHPDSKWARANLADRWVGSLEMGDDVRYQHVSSLGDLDHWRMEGLVTSTLAPEILAERLGKQLESHAHWISAGPTRAAAGVTRHDWTFKDDEGRTWNATLRLAPGDEAGQIRSTLEWSRSGAPAAR
jgi:putative intracellular protease/amidase